MKFPGLWISRERESYLCMAVITRLYVASLGGIVKATKRFSRYSKTGLMILMKVSHVRSSLACSVVQFVKSYICTAENKVATSEDLCASFQIMIYV